MANIGITPVVLAKEALWMLNPSRSANGIVCLRLDYSGNMGPSFAQVSFAKDANGNNIKHESPELFSIPYQDIDWVCGLPLAERELEIRRALRKAGLTRD